MPEGEKFNTLSHLFGAALALLGTIVMVVYPLREGEITKAVLLAVYGISLTAMYVSSVMFHISRGEQKDRFRRFDRLAIYLLIAGTYTPVTLLSLPSEWGYPMLVMVWIVAILGGVVDLVIARNRKPLSVSLYILMGWAILSAVNPLLKSITPNGVMLLVTGGLMYTLGAFTLRVNNSRLCHQLWHAVCLVASACHFMMIFLYVA